DWHTDPATGIKLDSNTHWAELSDDAGGDIKFIWEPSRFGMVYPLARAFAATRDERYAQAFWTLLQSWADANPPNLGPNWMDGQEAALRLMAWTFGFHIFGESPSTTPERVAQFVVLVASHAERIYKNIDYAISTHSNHTISEAFGLWLAGLLFPELSDAEKYFVLGQKLLEQEAAAQILRDGTYSMYSLNYHRFILHIYFYAIRLGELNKVSFSERLKSRVAKSVEYLLQLIDPETGQMPVYGSNDGALVLPLNNCDFTDYRPLLQLGASLTTGKLPFGAGPWDEDRFWLYGEAIPSSSRRKPGGEKNSFPLGGTFLLRGSNSKAILRCTDPHSRPSHADQLHVDLWMRGRNIACDAGTYLYSGAGPWRNGLAHTHVHNTVTVDHLDQMKMLTRFTWTDWSHGKVLAHNDDLWQGEHDGYKRLADPVGHKRTVISLPEDRWLIVDHLTAARPHHYDLHWLICDAEYGVQERRRGAVATLAPGFGLWLDLSDSNLPASIISIRMGVLEGDAHFSIVRADPNSTRGWRSRYYGDKEPAISALLETDQAHACFWTYFGFETDDLQIANESMRISSGDWNTTIDLNPLNK
ncbi:MAG: alginate lyase family protein, partial [Syntrophothermus sp.]